MISTCSHTSVKEIDTSTCSNSKKTCSLYQLVKQNSTDTKELFQLVNELPGNKDQKPVPEAKSDNNLVEEFAQFFLNKIEKIREQFVTLPT